MSKDFYTEGYVVANAVEIPNRPSFSNLTGNRFGKLTAVSWGGMRHNRTRNQWWCKCECSDTDFFLVDANSLKKGTSTSCGCNYENNGSVGYRRPNSFLEGKIDARYKVLKYEGMKHRCVISCTVCSEVVGKHTGYEIRQRGLVCSCKEPQAKDTRLDLVREYLSQYKYSLIGKNKEYLTRDCVDVQCLACGHTIKGIKPYQITHKCLCNNPVKEDGTPSSVYLLRDSKNLSYFKVGKANNPYTRLREIQKSVDKSDYDHKWRIEGIKWFASDKVAGYVEHTYHRCFKGKELYKYKANRGGEDVLEFDGAGETFVLCPADFHEFNKVNKQLLDYLSVNKPELVLEHSFNTNVNRVLASSTVTGVFIPSTPYLLERLGYADNIRNRKCIREGKTLEDIKRELSEIKKQVAFLEVDGVSYQTSDDFYLQNLHLRGSGVTLPLFKDRYFTKKWDVYRCINTARMTKKRYKIKDFDGRDITFSDFYRKYRPLCSYQTMKDMIQEGVSLQEVLDYVPKNSVTAVYLYKGQYYSLTALYATLKPIVARDVFKSRLQRGWGIDDAATKDAIDNKSEAGIYKETITKQLKNGLSVGAVWEWCQENEVKITKNTLYKYKRSLTMGSVMGSTMCAVQVQ